MLRFILTTFFLLFYSFNLSAFELQTEKVADNVYALVGEIGPRSKENLALNNTLGFVITDKGVLLVGTGATETAAALIEKAIHQVTDQPIVHIVNVGSQDHHWMGNSYFAQKGIPITVLARTRKTQQKHLDAHLSRLDNLGLSHPPKDRIRWKDKPVESDTYPFKLGNTAFELRYLGDSHFPNDAVLWLPEQKIVFTGDMVFNDRMLGIQPYSQTRAWLATFKKMAAMQPAKVIPGHGHAGDLAKAQKDTGDYLEWLVSEVSKAKEGWEDLGDMVERLAKTEKFDYLKFHEVWNPKNLNRTYLQFEAE